MGLKCIVCPDDVIGRGVLLIEEPEVMAGEAVDLFEGNGWEDSFEFVDEHDEVTRRFYVTHPTCFEKVYAAIFQREGSIAIVLCIGDVSDIVESLNVEGA